MYLNTLRREAGFDSVYKISELGNNPVLKSHMDVQNKTYLRYQQNRDWLTYLFSLNALNVNRNPMFQFENSMNVMVFYEGI